MTNDAELVFIGRCYYLKSRTLMSSIYTADGERSNWSQVEAALYAGRTVHIRPATPAELADYDAKLAALLERFAAAQPLTPTLEETQGIGVGTQIVVSRVQGP